VEVAGDIVVGFDDIEDAHPTVALAMDGVAPLGMKESQVRRVVTGEVAMHGSPCASRSSTIGTKTDFRPHRLAAPQ